MMRYVPTSKADQARRLVNFNGCGNIDVTGSVLGMQKLYGWTKGGQVRLGGYIYNIGPHAVQLLRSRSLLRGE
jgi:hypothetical protein